MPELDPNLYPFAQRQAQIERRKAMLAQAMRNQRTGYEPNEGRMVSGRYLAPSWSQNLAALVQPIADRQRVDAMGAELDSATAEFDTADRRAAIAHAMARPQGTPAQFTLPADQAGPSIPAQQPTQTQMAQWAQSGATIPSRRDVVSKIMADIEVNEPIRQEARTQRNQDREDRQKEARDKLVQDEAYRRDKLVQDEAYRRDRMAADAKSDAQRQADAQAMRVLIAQGQITANELRREQVRAAAEGKTAAETAAHAKERQEISEQARNAQERMDLLTEAAKAGETATGSGAGSVRDKALSIFGFSTEGAKGAAKLKALQAQLLTLTPKLGGATSDADVRNYREAVGQIGDETLPMATRLAAMDTVQAVNKRDYDNALARGNEFHARTAGKPGSGTSRPAAPASATPQKRVKFGDL